LKAVDALVDDIKKRETKVNILFISAGYFTFKGRDETEEGLDRKMVVHYYGRMRLVLGLLPLLQAGTADGPIGARVISILSPGKEGKVNTKDLDLKTSFGLKACAIHTVTFTSFAFKKLAAENPDIGWLHVFPGFVITDAAREVGLLHKVSKVAFSWLGVPHDNVGEGMVQLISAKTWKQGFALVQWDGKDKDTRKTGGWYSEETKELVWAHTNDILSATTG
jgi:NAD(P)-dependent dehydrogenase (short-subunit alcohol dehydrogenase family)